MLLESYPCFASDTAFRQSLEESSYGSGYYDYSETGQKFWAKMINHLYSDVFEQVTLSRETIIECFKVQHAPGFFKQYLNNVINKMIEAKDLDLHREAAYQSLLCSGRKDELDVN